MARLEQARNGPKPDGDRGGSNSNTRKVLLRPMAQLRGKLMPGKLLLLMTAVALSACSRGDRGALKPILGDGIELVSTHGLPKDTARLRAGSVTADVIGDWSNQGESVEIRYQMANLPAHIDMRSASVWKGQSAPATEVLDVSVREPGGTIGRPVLGARSLQLAPNSSKKVQIFFERLGKLERPRKGDEVTVMIPMPGGARAVHFRVAGQ